jgi:GT2 family glycosyltransferase
MTEAAQSSRAGRLGVITVTYQSAPFLQGFLRDVLAQSYQDFTLYCHDNQSSDATREQLRACTRPALKVVLHERNLGFAGANNLAIQQALRDGCEWVLLINNDTSFEPSLFAQLLEAALANRWDAVVPKIHFDAPKHHLWFGGGHFTPFKGHTGVHLGFGSLDTGRFDAPGLIDFAPMCCMLVHRSVFERVGLLDEAFFVYYEDTDYCWRMRELGLTLGYWPDAHMVHKVGGSTGGVESPFTALMAARNRLFFIRKHRSLVEALAWATLFIPYYVVRYLVRRFNPAGFRAALRGTFSFLSLRSKVPPLEHERVRSI